jgi:hypothetical protein
MQPIDFLQAVQFRLDIEKPKLVSDKIWSTSYKWFVNPILQCPYCKEWLETDRVWVVSEEEKKVMKVYHLQTRKSVNVELCHPHVGTAGRICMGNAQSTSEALFAGLSEDAYIKPYEWLPEELNHECDELVDVGDENVYYCENCGDQLSEDSQYWSDFYEAYYCSECHRGRHWNCWQCGNEWAVDDEYRYEVDCYNYCSDCFRAKFFECDGCGDVFKLSECAGHGLCDECYVEQYESCQNCGEEFVCDDQELDSNGLCSDCRPGEVDEEEEEDESTD